MSGPRICILRPTGRPNDFLTAPDLVMDITSGDAYARVHTPLTGKTGAELRALADEADATWADYMAWDRARAAQEGGEA